MITSVFSKSKPINFLICVGILIVYFVTHLFSVAKELYLAALTEEIAVLVLLIFSLFMIDFIIKKNALTQKNDVTLLLVTIFLGWFPSIFLHLKIVIIFVLVLLAFRRSISLRTLHNVKQKLFDASLYIGLAVLFDSWTVLYFTVIYLAIILFVANDYRNWLVPLLAYGGIIVMYYMYLYICNEGFSTNDLLSWELTTTYATNNTKRIILHILMLTLFISSFVGFLINYKALSSQKKLAFLLTQFLFFIGFFYLIFSKNNLQIAEILFVFPLAVSLTNALQNIDNKRITDTVFLLLIAVSICFYSYA